MDSARLQRFFWLKFGVQLLLYVRLPDAANNLGGIQDDFYKLLVAMALVRCLIWDDRFQESPKTGRWLTAMMRAYAATDPNDLYPLAGTPTADLAYSARRTMTMGIRADRS